MDQLTRSIKFGGAQYGGVMPPFEDKLNEDEIRAIIAYFQSKWTDQMQPRTGRQTQPARRSRVMRNFRCHENHVEHARSLATSPSS